MLDYQKLKVLESGSTSQSDDTVKEASIKAREKSTKSYKRDQYAQSVNKMLNNYIEDAFINEVDARLLVGMVTKLPVQDDHISRSKRPPNPNQLTVSEVADKINHIKLDIFGTDLIPKKGSKRRNPQISYD